MFMGYRAGFYSPKSPIKRFAAEGIGAAAVIFAVDEFEWTAGSRGIDMAVEVGGEALFSTFAKATADRQDGKT